MWINAIMHWDLQDRPASSSPVFAHDREPQGKTMSHFLDRLTFFNRQVGAFSNGHGLRRKAHGPLSLVHRGNAAAPAGLADLLERIAAELEPLMRRAGDADRARSARRAAVRAGGVDRRFHAARGSLRHLESVLCRPRKLADELIEHIDAENNKLFPRFVA